MSKKKRIVSPELPQTEGTLEVPNYVTPTTDLEYKRINDEVDPRGTDCEDCNTKNCKH